MERLTDKRLAIPPGQWQEVTREEARELKEIPIPLMRDLYYRLSQIEDILGEEYDLDRLSVLCNQRMTMREEVSERFGLTAKIPLDRLREIAEADREGRCVVLPIKIPGWGWCCNDKFPNAISAYFVYPSQVVDCMEDYILRGTKEEAEAALAKLNSET